PPVVMSPPPGSILTTALQIVGRVTSALSGNGIHLSVSCAGATPCQVLVLATTTETLHGSKVGSVAQRSKKRIVRGATLAATIAPGRTQSLTLKLNAVGRSLERRFGKLPVTVTVALALPSGKHSLVERTRLTLASPRRHHGRPIAHRSSLR